MSFYCFVEVRLILKCNSFSIFDQKFQVDQKTYKKFKTIPKFSHERVKLKKRHATKTRTRQPFSAKSPKIPDRTNPHTHTTLLTFIPSHIHRDGALFATHKGLFYSRLAHLASNKREQRRVRFSKSTHPSWKVDERVANKLYGCVNNAEKFSAEYLVRGIFRYRSHVIISCRIRFGLAGSFRWKIKRIRMGFTDSFVLSGFRWGGLFFFVLGCFG